MDKILPSAIWDKEDPDGIDIDPHIDNLPELIKIHTGPCCGRNLAGKYTCCLGQREYHATGNENDYYFKFVDFLPKDKWEKEKI